MRDVAYVTNGQERQKLDLYVPTSGTNAPLIVWIHGGAWRMGNRRGCPALPFLREGYAVASVDYRLSQDAVFPAQIDDCKAAIRWLRANARKNGIDPERIGAWGSSAGGHLAALLGTTGNLKAFDVGENLDVSSKVEAVCDWFGPTDFTQMSKFPSNMNHDAPDSPEALLIGGPVQENKEKAARANPITYVSRDDPPFLIMHGDQDMTVPMNQSELLATALRRAGAPVTFQVVRNGRHGFSVAENIGAVREFFGKELGGGGKG
jgi:acetyl esterase/lipase